MKANETLRPNKVYAVSQLEATLGSGLFKIALGSTVLALGCMAAALQALQRGAAGFAFHLSLGTIVAFAVGCSVGFLYWKLAARSLLAARVGIAMLLLAGAGAFLYPLRFAQADKMSDIAIGLGVATCAISLVASLLWKMKCFFEADAAAVETKNVL